MIRIHVPTSMHLKIIFFPTYLSTQAFLDLDDAMLSDESTIEHMAGSTAVVVLIKDNKLFCANAGDSRAIACINGNVEILSLDHKPNNDKEYKRICEAGGWVEYNRVNGNLALSRALGDFIFKKNTGKTPESQIVTGKYNILHLQRLRSFI